MSNIRVDLNTPIQDGTEVVFRSPVDCSQVTGLVVYYNGGSQEFAFADAHGNNVGDIDHLFAENVAVKVILDVTTSMAFVQNADTNAYLEGRFKALENKIAQGGGDLNAPDSHVRCGRLVLNYEDAEDVCILNGEDNNIYFSGSDISDPVRLSNVAEGKAPDDVVTVIQLMGVENRVNINEQEIAFLNDSIGDIETALDAIIAIQNELIGGDEA